MEKLERNIIFGIIDHLIIKKYPARTTRFGACPGLYDLVLLVVYKKNILESRPYMVFLTSAWGHVFQVGAVGSKNYLAKKTLLKFTECYPNVDIWTSCCNAVYHSKHSKLKLKNCPVKL